MKSVYVLPVSILILASCQSPTKKIDTFIPPPVVEKQPSWDGYEQNSGLINYEDGVGFIITPNAAKRYISLTEKFGAKLTPPISVGEGLKKYEENYSLSPEYMSVFMEVSRLNKN